MYCGSCGADCIIPDGYECTKGLGCIAKEGTNDFKVIRCVECTNKFGTDTETIHVCVKIRR